MPVPADEPGYAIAWPPEVTYISLQSLLLFDGSLRVISASPSFCAQFEIAEGQANGRSLSELGGGEWDRPELRILLQLALSDGAEAHPHVMNLARPNAGARRLLMNARKVVRQNQESDDVLLTIDDVTDARLSHKASEALLREKDRRLGEFGTLIEEMRHRIANSLQIIANILMLKAQAVQSDESRQLLEDAHDRVLSVALTQEHLQFGLDDVAVGPYLTKLCDSLAQAMIRNHRPIALTVEADDVTLASHEAVSLGLVVTELVINAMKHAFPNGRAGTVCVRYRGDQENWRLSVADDGVGSAQSAGDGAGLGRGLVEALARQLSATVESAECSPGLTVGLIGRRRDPTAAPSGLSVTDACRADLAQ